MRVEDSVFRVQFSGDRVHLQGPGFSVQCSGFRVWGVGCYTASAGSERIADCMPEGRVPYGREMKYKNAPCAFNIPSKYLIFKVHTAVNI